MTPEERQQRRRERRRRRKVSGSAAATAVNGSRRGTTGSTARSVEVATTSRSKTPSTSTRRWLALLRWCPQCQKTIWYGGIIPDTHMGGTCNGVVLGCGAPLEKIYVPEFEVIES